jgi:hypothetical protein
MNGGFGIAGRARSTFEIDYRCIVNPTTSEIEITAVAVIVNGLLVQLELDKLSPADRCQIEHLAIEQARVRLRNLRAQQLLEEEAEDREQDEEEDRLRANDDTHENFIRAMGERIANDDGRDHA